MPKYSSVVYRKAKERTLNDEEGEESSVALANPD